MELPHALPPVEVAQRLQVQVAEGLGDAEAARRLVQHGPNAIAARRTTPALALLLHQFLSPVVALLVGAGALALGFGEHEEAAAIAAVLGLNALIGFATELKAARSMEALRALGSRTARVRRGGQVRLVPAETLVPGDVVLLDAGDAVPADLRLAEVSRLAADESTLTGESVAVDKQVPPVSPGARLGDRASMLFQGTAVTRGSGTGLVVATGPGTELGRVTQLVMEADPGRSPLERKLARLSTQLVWATLAIAGAIGTVGAFGDQPRLMVEAAIALAVAAIPEGLPIVATLALARGMWRMARQKVLIERLSAVETLGATTVILMDKTGTLTENRMTVRRLWTAAGELDLQPAPDAAARRLDGNAEATALLRVAVLCNDATLDADDAGSGDPMEVALLRAGLQAGLTRPALITAQPLAGKHAFETDTRLMATVHADGDGFLVAVKGAPEAVLAAATQVQLAQGAVSLDPDARAEWTRRAEQLGRRGLRVLACACRRADRADAPPYERLVLLGLVALEDPARADVPQAIDDCRQAGIRVVMVTGDHAVTARSIGLAVGLGAPGDAVIEGQALSALAAADPAALRRVAIFARVNPAEKLALVKACQAAGDVVAMTGDGVNDAPALRQADIGVAMGLRGTDVAREAAAMVLLDDAFPSIVRAIREGRVIFANIRCFVMYLLSCNLSEVVVVGLAVLLALPLPVLPLQILYLNLVTDVLPAFALAMGDGEQDILQHPPRDPKEPLLGRRQWAAVVLQAGALAAGTFGALALARGLGLGAAQSVTVTFLTLAFAQVWHVLDMRHPRSRLLVNEVTRNRWVWGSTALCSALLVLPTEVPALARLLNLVPLDATLWAMVMGCSLAPVALLQVAGWLLHRRRSRPSRMSA